MEPKRIAALPAIYRIYNVSTGQSLVGSTMNARRRLSIHLAQIKASAHPNALIRRSVKEFGIAAFSFDVLEVLPFAAGFDGRELLTLREEYWALKFNALDERHGFNFKAGRQSSLGYRFRDRERKLMRQTSMRYQLLPWVDTDAPIEFSLLASWDRGNQTLQPSQRND